MAKLDKSKDYGTIVGDSLGRCFEQGGKYFDAEGAEVTGTVAVDPRDAEIAALKKALEEKAEKDKGGKPADSTKQVDPKSVDAQIGKQ